MTAGPGCSPVSTSGSLAPPVPCTNPAGGSPPPSSPGRVHTFTIHGHLPGLNEIIDANRTGYHVGANQKKCSDATCTEAIIRYGVPHFPGPVRISFHWYARDRRRDPDNVAAAKKFILDALVDQGVLVNDSWAYIKRLGPDDFDVDKSFPRVEVTVTTL